MIAAAAVGLGYLGVIQAGGWAGVVAVGLHLLVLAAGCAFQGHFRGHSRGTEGD